MKKIYIITITLVTVASIILVASLFFKNTLKKDGFFNVPSSVDQVIVTSANYSLPPEYVKEQSKTYTSKEEIKKFLQMFDSLSLDKLDTMDSVGKETIVVDFYETGKKIKSYTFYDNNVLNKNNYYTVKGNGLSKFLNELKMNETK